MIGRRRLLAAAAATAFGAFHSFAAAARGAAPLAPKAPLIPVRREIFGRVRTDDYDWLRTRDWHGVLRDPTKLEPAIRDHLLAENAYAEAMLAPTAALQETFVAEMARFNAASPPPLPTAGAWDYYPRYAAGADHPVFVRRPKNGGAEQVLFDMEAAARGKAYYALAVYQAPLASPDDRYFAWAIDEVGSEYNRLFIHDIEAGRIIDLGVSTAYGAFAFAPDSSALYWLERDPYGRPGKIHRRRLATGEDSVVHEETDPAFFVTLTLSASGRYLFIRSFNADASDVRFVSADDPSGALRLIEPRQSGLQYDVEDWRGQLVILTNADGATNYKLMSVDPGSPGRANWRELVPHRAGRYISAIRPFETHLVRTERVEANPRFVVRGADGAEREIAFDDPAYALPLAPSQPFTARSFRYAHEAPASPLRWIDEDLASGARTVTAPKTPAGFDPAAYVVERIFARSSDGASIPITVLRKRSTPLDGRAPLYMYGYGSYGFSVEADFHPSRLPLVDRGWVCALAHVRGGSERGAHWWRDVLTTGKKRTFEDFVACAEHLAAKGYTRKGRIVSHSLSAGGLLVGATANDRPDLFAGVIAQVPFVDPINSMADMTAPLWFTATPIWGDPRKPADYDYLAGYSPYDNIRPQLYPATLATTAIGDNRVPYWEAVKWTVRIREKSASGAPNLAMINMQAGHVTLGQFGPLRQAALFNAFAISAVDRSWPRG